MAGYIGARASVVSSGAERKQTYAITTTTTSLTGLAYTPTKVHVYHNGIRLVDGTDYTATNGTSITLTTAAENGDEVVVISYATFQTSDTVSAANGGTFAGNVSMSGTLDVAGNVGIGTTSPSNQLSLYNSGTGQYDHIKFNNSYGGADGYIFSANTSVGVRNTAGGNTGEAVILETLTNDLKFFTSGSEAARVDASGRLLVGKTGQGLSTAGFEVEQSGQTSVTQSAASCIRLNRLSSDGDIIQLRKDTSQVGSIGNSGNYMYLASLGPSARGVKITDNFIPATTSGANNDNVMDLGGASVRWDDVYATNGTIQTSDRNEKQDIAELDEAEKRVAVAAKGLIRKYRWIDAVQEKGDDARIHVGIIAQDLQAAFEAEGLDASRYAMFISSTWWEADETYTDDDGVEQTRTNTYETQEEAPEGATERTRLGVRYPELLAFIIGAL